MNGTFDRVETKVVGGAEGHSRFDAAAGQPHGERLRMMIATQFSAQGGIRLDHRRANIAFVLIAVRPKPLAIIVTLETTEKRQSLVGETG